MHVDDLGTPFMQCQSLHLKNSTKDVNLCEVRDLTVREVIGPLPKPDSWLPVTAVFLIVNCETNEKTCSISYLERSWQRVLGQAK